MNVTPTETLGSPHAPHSLFFGSGFDGANSSSKRGYVEFDIHDDRRELDYWSRNEIIKKVRYLTENVGLCKNFVNGISTLRGHVTPYGSTEEEEWNTLTDDYILERGGNAELFDVSGKFDLFSVQNLLSRHQLTDGDHATIFSQGKSGEAMFQFLESTRLRSPSGKRKEGWIDGVFINKVGKPLGYNFKDYNNKDKRVDAKNVLLFTQLTRTGYVRSIPPFAHAVNHATDITEIVADLKHGIKAANLFGFVMTGVGLQGNKPITSAQEKLQGKVTPEGNPITTEKVGSSGVVINAPAGASVETVKDARPHQNQLDLINMLISEIYAGTGYPPEVLWHLGNATSPQVRFIMARAKLKVHEDRMMLDKWVRDARTYMIWKGIESGSLPRPRQGFQWWKSVTMGQADPTIDRAKDKQDWDLVLAGGKSMQSFCAERGIYWKDHLGQLVKIRRYFSDKFPEQDLGKFFKCADGALIEQGEFRQGG